MENLYGKCPLYLYASQEVGLCRRAVVVLLKSWLGKRISAYRDVRGES